MDTKTFINNVKVELSKEYIKDLIDAYILSELPANSLNAFDNIIADPSLVGVPDRQTYRKIVAELLHDHIAAGGNAVSFNASFLSNPHRLTFNSHDINKSGNKYSRINRFGIAVNDSNLFAVLKGLLEKAKEVGYSYDIDFPIVDEFDKGIMDTINLYCSSNNLEETIKFLNSLGEELTSMFEINNSKTMMFNTSISFDTYNAEAKKWSKDVFGEALVAAIDNVISEAVEKASIQVTMEDANYYNNEHDMTTSYHYMMGLFNKSNVDFYQLVIEKLKEKLKEMNIDPTNIFMSKALVGNLYIINSNAGQQISSPKGFVAAGVVKAKPAVVSFEKTSSSIDPEKRVLGDDDIPDLPEGFVPMMQTSPQVKPSVGAPVPPVVSQPVVAQVPQAGSVAPSPKVEPVVQTPGGLIKGPEIMLVPEMLERHHDDNDMENLYHSFQQIRNSEAQISSKIMQLNQIWPDLTYADFVAFRQFDRTSEYIPDTFIQLWVNNKQEGKMPTVSSEELYKEKPPVAAPTVPPQPQSAPVPPVGTPVPGADAQIQQLPVQGGMPQSTGMYSETPVQVRPIEDQVLTQEEVAALVGNNLIQLSPEALNKYSFIPNPQATLSATVLDLDGNQISLYNYLEKYNVLDMIPINATVTTPEGVVTGAEFIVNNLSQYVVTNGAITVEAYLELFNIDVNTKDSKSGIIGKIFK